MHTPAQIANHPIHPMLVTIPIGLWVFSLVADMVYRFGGGNEVWDSVAFYTMVGGVVGALLAAIPGVIDMLSLKAPVKKIAIGHMVINLAIVALYFVNIGMRIEGGTTGLPVLLSVVAVGSLLVSGWLGGHMVYVHGVAVNTAGSVRAEDPNVKTQPELRRGATSPR
jgi:uncharacterized membrane protein